MAMLCDKLTLRTGSDDSDRSGDIDTQEIVTMLASAKDEADIGMQHVTDVLHALGKKSESGTITLEQFQVG